MINATVLNNLREQFFLKHGDRVLINNRFYFEDGAFADHDPMGVMAEPPDDPLQRAKLQVKFWNGKLQRSADAFDRLRENLRQAGIAAKRSGYSPPDDDDLVPLRLLAKTVKRLQKELKRATELVEALTPKHLKNQASDFARNAQQAEEFIDKIKSIRV